MTQALPKRLIGVLSAVVFLVGASQALAAAPGTPDLVSSSDSGSSSTDNITSDTTPDFTASNSGLDTVRLCIVTAGSSATPTDHGTSSADPATFTASTLTAGSWDVTARSTSTDCTDGEVSGTLTITVDTTAPTLLLAPTLVDFVGSNPSFTFTSTPRFDVIVESGASVTLYEGSTSIGTETSEDGKARVLVSTALSDGDHTITAKATDTAGNTSSSSSSVTITVDSTPASAGAPDLIDDDGDSATDNYTTAVRPRFTVATEANARVTLYEDGLALGSAAADSGGVATVQPRADLWFDAGVHCVYAIAMDSLANSGTESDELCITVAPGVEPFTTNLGVTISNAALKLSLRSTVAARARIKVKYRGRVIAQTRKLVRADKNRKVRVRLNRKARKARRLLVVTTFRSTDGRKIVVRRVIRVR